MNPVKGSKEYFQTLKVDHRPECVCIICAYQKGIACADCNDVARRSWSDATTPGFCYDKCDYHRKPVSK